MGTDGLGHEDWARGTGARALLTSIAVGIEPDRAATAARFRGRLTRGHVFALLDVIKEYTTVRSGITDAGTILYHWVLYLSSPTGVGVCGLPTERSAASKALLQRCRRAASTHKAAVCAAQDRTIHHRRV